MTNLRQQLPELSEGQMKLLYRLIADEVIGQDEFPEQARQSTGVQQLMRNQLRTEQRQQLATLINDKEMK